MITLALLQYSKRNVYVPFDVVTTYVHSLLEVKLPTVQYSYQTGCVHMKTGCSEYWLCLVYATRIVFFVMDNIHDTSTEEEIVIDHTPLPPKKHKKHKHKKHKKKRSMESHNDIDVQEPLMDDISAASLKLKIKLAKESSSPSTSTDKMSGKGTPTKTGDKVLTTNLLTTSSPKIPSKKKKSKGKDSGTSSEEERWLDAIESGKLEEVDDELKKIKPKDPKLMTARQRAMFERKTDKEPSPGGEQLLALPSGYKEKVMTVEALQKAALKSQKRKQLADEKREKDKKKTMERLLKKQDSKSGKVSKSRSSQKVIPRVTYIYNSEGVMISLPLGVEFPLAPQSQKTAPTAKKCGVIGCSNNKRYSCSKTGIPLCSLECYHKNQMNR